ncbi:Ran-binding protein 1 c [Tetrabaena socialis]|uniref:Ran-binding protein 1 c n=1 Tax=Tetrabaena socialis TaxID=47790 RepID=A0A2J8AC44_9CHLO|nr:Ran-binding protein 1 c [Tetrabaena socialis]|eukprot:PNH10090.1 Ran-binding protein 1 c [Tetrabaena socialis]
MADAAETSTAPQPANPFAALGSSGAAFGGAGTGAFSFGAPTAAFGAPAKEGGEEGEEGGDDAAAGAEEECQAEFKPLVQLDEVEAKSGEEEEDTLVDLKCKLYRFDGENNEWKERGLGIIKLLQHKENKKVRLLMRQEKTLKIRANHIVMPGTKLQEHSGSDKAWVWSAVDFAEGKQSIELFAVRFGTVEKAQEYKKKFEEAMDINAALLGDVAALPKADEEAGGAAAEAEAEELAKEVEEKATTKDE